MGCERQFRTAQGGLAKPEVQLHWSDGEGRWPGIGALMGGASQDGANPGGEFPGAEGFCNVIVCAEVEAGKPILLVHAGR